MNNKVFALAIAGTLALASCQNEGTGTMDDAAIQARIDSAVNAREEQLRTELAMQNDSLINAMAMVKADSMMAAMNAGRTNTGTGRVVRPTRPTTTTPTKPPTVGNGKPSMSGNTTPGTVGNGKPSMNNSGNQRGDNTTGNGKPKMNNGN